MTKEIKNIIVVGGGSAGWMTAATLIKSFPHKSITVIESANIPTVGVGESTIGGIRLWTQYLGIDDKEFLQFTDGSYKLSIKFTDFYPGEAFHYPFGDAFVENNKADANDWWFKKWVKQETPYSDYADCLYPQMAMVNQNKISYNREQKIPFNFYKDSAFHFDATKFGLWLREKYCKPKGVKHIEDDIIDVETDQNDNVINLKGKHNNYQNADLYVDCTGFKSLLLKSTGAEFESYADMLPNNSAWATKIPYTDKPKQLKAYTNCTALGNGWVWNIPLWSRIGTGYVYSDKFIDDEGALKEFKQHLGREELEFKNIKMRVGIHKKIWNKNVVGIGLSAGFIEPLESNGLFSVHEFVMRLVRSLNRGFVSQWDKDNFNFQCHTIFRNFAEFVALHYALSPRQDTEYWRQNFNKDWISHAKGSNGLMQMIKDKHSVFHFPHTGGFNCIAAGLHYSPTELENVLYYTQSTKDVLYKEFATYIDQLDRRKKQWDQAVIDFPTLYDFLSKEIYNK